MSALRELARAIGGGWCTDCRECDRATDAAGEEAAAERGEAAAELSHQGALGREALPVLTDLVRLGGVRNTSADLRQQQLAVRPDLWPRSGTKTCLALLCPQACQKRRSANLEHLQGGCGAGDRPGHELVQAQRQPGVTP